MSSFNTWSYHSPVQPSPALVQQIEAFGRLEPPRDNYTSSLTPIDRYVEDVPTGAIVTHDTRSLHPPPSLLRQGYIACSNPGSDYQRSLQDQVDNDSLCSESNNLCYTGFEGSTESSSGSLGEDDYHHQQSSASTSPDYHGSGFEKTWAQGHPYMTQASDLHASVDPNLAHGGYVCLKEVVHISPCGDDRSQEGHNDSMEDDDENGLGYPQTVPVMFQQPGYDRCCPVDQPPPPMGVFSHQHDPSLGHGHSCPSAQGSRQSSPARTLKLKTIKNRRVKGCPEMMKPFSEVSGEGEKARKARGEKTRGRGAGKKPKERKICREHPGKVFVHASDYKKHMNQQHLRPFLCVFYFSGCIQTFGSKNEWKRHVYSQHLQISYWHCDDPMCADRKAIFNRKDLFGQHIKRMHPPPAGPKTSTAAYMDEMIERCRVERRKPPQSSRCGYCKQTFSGAQSWEQRMEHVGQHYEKNNYKGISRDRWVPDEGLIAWSLEHGIIEDNGAGGYATVSTGKDAIVRAGVEQKKMAKKEMARALRYPDDCDVDDYDDDADGDVDYC
ncbi:unnamed protein product [Tuber melanosporum]|uniref:(Perigord truffle) hypothetical protein n=1 Tax=Tuber melanosporum (strain Mel28) TaxID=656061 RepID=D5GAQ0_TUBMM|nr:uncharacterized protein GSTUM_00003726001 [Tuber melanosporum]CAZ81593.1 unnamed protein product [Tuber melanosporum]